MIVEHDSEPVRGLPGYLPANERMLWQGSPDWKRLAYQAFHVRIVGGYFLLLGSWGAVQAARGLGTWMGVGITFALGLAGVVVLGALALLASKTTVYTLTDRRIVLRFGMALPKCINLPLATIVAADVRSFKDGTGDIPLQLDGPQRLGWIQLWPHARPWRAKDAQPMLRAIPDAARVAGLLGRTVGAAQGKPVAVPAPKLAVAA